MKSTELLKKDHKVILKMLDIIDALSSRINKNEHIQTEHLSSIVEFIKIFADKCHHGKEEKLLFPAMEEAGIPKYGGPIEVMLAEHEQGRGYVKAMTESINQIKASNTHYLKEFGKNASSYSNLLRQHIYKEDNILYMMADMHIDKRVDSELLEKFEVVEREIVGEGRHKEFEKLIDTLSKFYL